jgi:hypothetical protein
VTLDALIAVEAVAFMLLMGLLLALLPSLRQGRRSGVAREPAAEAPPPPAPAAVPSRLSPPPAVPVAQLRSSRFMKGIAAVPAEAEAPVPCFPAMVKIEPARETRWKGSRASKGEEPPAGAVAQARPAL